MKQFQRLHQEMQEGGFSEHIPTATKPEPPGFMVSDFGPEYKVPSHLNSPQLLETYAKTHGLDQSPPGEFMGGWQEEGNLDYSDVSRKYPDASRGHIAMTFQNQKSMFDLTKEYGEEGAYIDNPDFDPDYTPEEHERRMSDPSRGEIRPTWLRPSLDPVIRLRPAGEP